MAQIGSGPIEPDLVKEMNVLAEGLDKFLNPGLGVGEKRKIGFILMTFKFGVGGDMAADDRCNYISTAHRADVITLLKEQLSYFEGMPDETPAGKA